MVYTGSDHIAGVSAGFIQTFKRHKVETTHLPSEIRDLSEVEVQLGFSGRVRDKSPWVTPL